jgi:hypothetical protein
MEESQFNKNCLFLQNRSFAPLLLTVLHPPLSCDHSVIFQRLVPRKEEGLSKKIPPWDATVLLLSSVAYRSERGVIKCPLHFLQEALYNPPSLLYVHSVWVYKKRLYINASKILIIVRNRYWYKLKLKNDYCLSLKFILKLKKSITIKYLS